MEITVVVSVFGKCSGEIYLSQSIGIFLITGSMELLAVNPADFLCAIFLPYLCHGTNQRMGIAFLLREQQSVTPEPGVRGKITAHCKQAVHIDFYIKIKVLFPTFSSAILSIAPGCFPDNTVTSFSQSIYNLAG